MTGIERLYKLSEDVGYKSLWNLLLSGREDDWDCEEHDGKTLDATLTAIAEQIKREHAEDCFRMGVRAAEDREAAAWVREHGGLDYVRAEWRSRSNLKRTCEKLQAKVERQQRHIEFVQGKCRDRQGHIVDLSRMVEKMRPRLMPEGYEWPTVDGRKVDFKTPYQPSLGVLEAVSIYSNGACEVMSHDGIIKPVSEIHVVVPAADGEPLEDGQTVWHVSTGREYTVRDCTNGGAHLSRDGKPAGYCRAEYLTHQRPEPPDTWQCIEEDARGLDSGVDRELFTHTHEDLVRRCRALAERERGE